MRRSILILAALLASLAIPPQVLGGDFRTCSPSVPGQYVVVFEEGFPPARQAARATRAEVKTAALNLQRVHGGRLDHVYEAAIQGFSIAQMPEQRARALAKNPRVAYVEEDCLFQPSATQTNAPWHLDRIDDRSPQYTENTYVYTETAENVHAYVIDFLVADEHTEFKDPNQPSRVVSRVNCIFADSSGNCTSISPGARWPIDGHGTAVASIIGGKTVGAAKKVKLHSVEVCSNDGCPASRVIAGINWTVNNHIKPAITNISINFRDVTTCTSSYTFTEAFAVRSSIDYAISAGIPFTISAGNCDSDACWYPPANTSAAVVVAYTNSSDRRSIKDYPGGAPIWGSNYGSCVDLFAPGEDVEVAWTGSTTHMRVNAGSSFAAPLVAGVAALYLAGNPTATPADVTNWLISQSSKNLVIDPKGSPNRLLFQPFQ